MGSHYAQIKLHIMSDSCESDGRRRTDIFFEKMFSAQVFSFYFQSLSAKNCTICRTFELSSSNAHLESSQPGVVIPHHQILQPVRSHSDQITKLFKRSTKLMFGVQTSPRHKMTKADFLWKRLWNIFYRVCVSVRGLTFSDFMIRKSDEVFTTFAVLAFVNSRQTKNPLNNKMENAIIMSSIKRIMI